MQFSPIIRPASHTRGPEFSVQSINMDAHGYTASSLTMMDHFRVSGCPFGPHPHAGFSAVTYVLPESAGGLRSRDSLGNDIVVGAGGIVWTQAAKGLIHHELPAQPGKELHGLQFFVNLKAKNKLIDPHVFWLESEDVPVCRSEAGDCIRVVVGSFGDKTSPLEPAEPFTLLDADLVQGFSLVAQPDNVGLLYLLSGEVVVATESTQVTLQSSQALVIEGSGHLKISVRNAARLLCLSGARNDEPKIMAGSFLMNSKTQIDDAALRYQNGEMGNLLKI